MDEAHLREIPLFASLSKDERRRVAMFADELEVPEGTELLHEGDIAWEFFAIEEGQAEVLHDGRHVADLEPGDFMGEIAALDHSRRRASVVAKSPMKLMVMTDYDFRRLTHEVPALAARIREVIEQRTAQLVG